MPNVENLRNSIRPLNIFGVRYFQIPSAFADHPTSSGRVTWRGEKCGVRFLLDDLYDFMRAPFELARLVERAEFDLNDHQEIDAISLRTFIDQNASDEALSREVDQLIKKAFCHRYSSLPGDNSDAQSCDALEWLSDILAFELVDQTRDAILASIAALGDEDFRTCWAVVKSASAEGQSASPDLMTLFQDVLGQYANAIASGRIACFAREKIGGDLVPVSGGQWDCDFRYFSPRFYFGQMSVDAPWNMMPSGSHYLFVVRPDDVVFVQKGVLPVYSIDGDATLDADIAESGVSEAISCESLSRYCGAKRPYCEKIIKVDFEKNKTVRSVDEWTAIIIQSVDHGDFTVSREVVRQAARNVSDDFVQHPEFQGRRCIPGKGRQQRKDPPKNT